MKKFNNLLDNHLVGHFDSGEFSEAWRENFTQHPSWCDADMSLQQINAGKATGNKISLYARSLFQRFLYELGRIIQNWPNLTLIIGLFLLILCCIGLKDATIETDIVKLWVPKGGRLEDELNYYTKIKQDYFKRQDNGISLSKNLAHIIRRASMPEVPKENGLGDAFQVVIQNSEIPGQNLLNKEGLLRHVDLMTDISGYTVNLYGRNWSLSDICFKTPEPNLPHTKILESTKDLMTKIIPCIWITPIDCFWEGAKPLGPNPPVDLPPEVADIVTAIPRGHISWKNLNPRGIADEFGSILDASLMENFFNRAGVGSAYTTKPCIDPLDPECPDTSPNYFNICRSFKKFDAWNSGLRENEQVRLEAKAETIVTTTEASNVTDYYDYNEESGEAKGLDYLTRIYKNLETKQEDPEKKKCEMFSESFLKWMEKNKNRWGEFLDKAEQPQYPDYGKILAKGCTGFGEKIMKWPESLIVGGVKRSSDGSIDKIEAFQSVFLVASPEDLYQRLKPIMSNDTHLWSPVIAKDIITTWQRNFTHKIYNHEFNDVIKNIRVVHPLASTNIRDILAEFSQFDFKIIFMGYGLMILYAAWTQFSWEGFWFSPKSTSCLAIVGVLLITFSFIAGLGISVILGFQFNASTTQVIPFLALGLGISDMFLLLNHYTVIINYVKKDEIAILLKESGMAVIITSMNIILAFVVGVFLPTPALKAFCAQVAILLFFNLLCNMILFTACMAKDLSRRKAGVRDMTLQCCINRGDHSDARKSSKVSPEIVIKHEEKRSFIEHVMFMFVDKVYNPLLKQIWFKAVILIISIAMFVFGLIGLINMTLGLELSDVLPEGTPPSAFLQVREKYFGFYPMFDVLKGSQIDIPHQQKLIQDLHSEIANSTYAVRPTNEYWLSLFRDWLESLQKNLDDAIDKGFVSANNGSVLVPLDTPFIKISQTALLARRLVCSHGQEYNCENRVGKIRLVENGIINPDGFYNYLTAWFAADNMMYYVSQASFFPTPVHWEFNPIEDKLIPPAEPLQYSQIPFYLNNLINTEVIMKMIKEIRGICEKYSNLGVSNFPTGIPFTFWEQYLRLTSDLVLAIAIIAGTVFLVISIIIFNPWAASMITLVVLLTTIQLAGFMGIFGVKLNPVSSVTLISAVGIGVEFTAYITLSFLAALGSRNERMAACLDHMYIPVVHGGISALLGLLMLAFTPFTFIFKYFFVVMTVLILIGMFNGVALLPVLLSLIGPTSEVLTKDGSNRLPCPSPSDRKKIRNGSNNEESSI